MIVRWTPLAIERLSDIVEYISVDNPNAAIKWAEEVFEKVNHLEKYPESGRILPEFNKSDLREIIFNNYRIIYRSERKQIAILTVKHCRQVIKKEELKKK